MSKNKNRNALQLPSQVAQGIWFFATTAKQATKAAAAVTPLYGRDSLASTRFFGVAAKKFQPDALRDNAFPNDRTCVGEPMHYGHHPS